MKHYIKIAASLALFSISLSIYTVDDFNIIIKSKWCDLAGNCTNSNEFGGKWILVGSFTFKKRSKDPLHIENITLHWNGEPLDNLIASLYKKMPDKEFLPIEDNLICDGLWNKTKQKLIFNFDERENLRPTTVFYLVLTIPEGIESILKKGHFDIEEQCLPKAFKHCANNEKLSLAINDTSIKKLSH